MFSERFGEKMHEKENARIEDKHRKRREEGLHETQKEELGGAVRNLFESLKETAEECLKKEKNWTENL